MRILNLLAYLAIPLAYASHFLAAGKSWEAIVTFILAGCGAIPLAFLIGHSTEDLATHVGPTWGALLNATFGNAAELIIAVIAVSKGLNHIVAASLTGSILGNLLLVSGGAILVGGWNREKQSFSRISAETNAGLLILAVAAMLFPAIFHHTYESRDPHLTAHEHGVSICTSVILLSVYALGLFFALRTHAHLFSPQQTGEQKSSQTVKTSILWLLVGSIGVALVAELLVGAAATMATQLGWNEIFVGIVLLAIIGNAAEHSTAIMLAKSDHMNTAMEITYQSSVQIALFVTPAIVLLSAAMAAAHVGHAQPMDLIFSPMEIVAVLLSVLIVVVVNMNGQTNWLEGVMLLALYAILAIGFFYIPVVTVGR